MRKLGNWALLLLTVVLIFQIVTFAPKTLDQTKKAVSPTGTDNQATIEQKMARVHLVETGTTEREWELWADEAVTYKSTSVWKLEKVKVSFFSDNEIEYVVNGNRGEVHVESKNMIIDGDVVIITSNGYRLTSQRFLYDSKSRVLSAPTPVQAIGPKEPDGGQLYIAGETMNADLRGSSMQIKGKVRSHKKIQSGKKMYIQSNEAQIASDSLEANFNDNVQIDIDTMQTRGKKATLQYSNLSKSVETVIVTGKVRVTDVDRLATSDKMIAFLPEEKYELIGSPRLIQNNDELRGERIVFLNGGKKVQVLRGKASVQQRPNGG